MDEIQHRLWDTEQEILDEIHRICTENGLRYSLAYGTLLGAVRHGGFIPWDDDIDVMMPREDYDRLFEIWDQVASPGFIPVMPDNNPDYYNTFSKIVKDHTTFLQFEEQRKNLFHKGIFVDIFPLDRKAPKGLPAVLQFAAFAVNLLYNRGYPSGAHGLLGLGERILLGIVPKKSYRRISRAAGRFSRRWNHCKDAAWIDPGVLSGCRRYYPAAIFDRLETMCFRGKTYSVFRDWDEVLRLRYGDYMTLPPEEERIWRHHPIILDFEHNYDEREQGGQKKP